LETLKSKAGNLLDSTEIVKDSFNQQKYSRLADASYNFFNSNGDADAVKKGLSGSDYSHLGLEKFEVDKDLSSIDNVVLHNKVKGETHISFRGTTDDIKKTGQFPQIGIQTEKLCSIQRRPKTVHAFQKLVLKLKR